VANVNAKEQTVLRIFNGFIRL